MAVERPAHSIGATEEVVLVNLWHADLSRAFANWRFGGFPLEYQICSPCGIPVYAPFSDFTACISLHDFESSEKLHVDNVQYCQIHFFLIAFFIWELSNEEDNLFTADRPRRVNDR